MHSESELGVVHGEKTLCTKRTHGRRRILRQHVDVTPPLVVLPVLEDSKINVRESLPDRFIMLTKASISTNVNGVFSALYEKGSPQ